MDRGAWWATVHSVAKSQTRLKQFSTHSRLDKSYLREAERTKALLVLCHFGFGVPTPVLEKEMATHSSILAWRIPWTEEPGRLQSTG